MSIITHENYLYIGTYERGVWKRPLVATGVHDPFTKWTPEEYHLSQNYPNPFNPVTTIRFHVQPAINQSLQKIKLAVYDFLGKEVAILVYKNLAAGDYEVKFDGNNYPSGTYFYHLEANGITQTKKMILLK